MKLSTSISPNYVKGWTIGHAIREIVQNYLDSRQEFECAGNISWKRGLGVVKDYGPGMDTRHLALGISEKDVNAKGKYGEGLKLALLVFAREGRKVEIWTKGKRITPSIEYDEGYGTDVMVLNIEDLPARMIATHTGTSIKFECSERELKIGKSYFIEFASRDLTWLEQGKISLPGGLIYINGTAVGLLKNAMFSYHLQERNTGNLGNRDRTIIDMAKVRPHIQKVLGETSSTEAMRMIGEMILNRKQDAWEWELDINGWNIPSNKEKVWRTELKKVFGDRVISTGDPEKDHRAMYKGYSVIPRPSHGWMDVLETVKIPNAEEVTKVSANMKSNRVAISSLTPEQKKNLEKARTLVEAHYAEVGEVWIMEELSKVAGINANSTTCLGLYSSEHDRTYLDVSILDDFRKTLDTMLHETVHKVSQARDLSESFQNACLSVAVGMMMKR